MYNVKSNEDHAVVTVKIAITTKYSFCNDVITDGLNEILNAAMGDGFVADYAFTDINTVRATNEPEEGELLL